MTEPQPATVQFPTVSVRRGGIRYPQPGTPEAEARARQYEQDRAAYDRRQAEGEGTVTGHVWLAQIDNGYDGTRLIEVCATEERARQACVLAADSVRSTAVELRWDEEGQGWAGNGSGPYHLVTRTEVRG